jgi:hypothetical protein
MGYHALITLDLSETADNGAGIFHGVLINEKWVKVRNLPTTWRVSFQDGVTRQGAVETLKNDLRKAKEAGSTSKVFYAIQLETIEPVINNL